MTHRFLFVSIICFSLTACGGSTPDPKGSNDGLVKKGKSLFTTSCESCHGPEGHGDGPSAKQLKPPPMDFAKHPWRIGTDEASIRKSITKGIPGTQMPAYTNYKEEELQALVAFIQTLTPKEPAPAGLPEAIKTALEKAKFTAVSPVKIAPALELLDANGKKINLSDFSGRAVVLHFFSLDAKYLSALEKLATESKPIEFLAVCGDESDHDKVADLGAKTPKLGVYALKPLTAKERFEVKKMPTTCIIDAQGSWIATFQGEVDWNGTFQEVLKALK